MNHLRLPLFALTIAEMAALNYALLLVRFLSVSNGEDNSQ